MNNEANKLVESIHWLNDELQKTSYVNESFRVQEQSLINEKNVIQSQLRTVNNEIASIEAVIDRLEKNESLEEQAVIIKYRCLKKLPIETMQMERTSCPKFSWNCQILREKLSRNITRL